MLPGRVLAGCMVIASSMISVPAHAEMIQVTIDGLIFSPAEITAKIGDTVVWRNKDIVAHTATARSGFDVMIEPDKSASLVLTKAGIVDYYCSFHPNMTEQLPSHRSKVSSEAGGDLDACCPAEYDCQPYSRYRQPQACALSVCPDQRLPPRRNLRTPMSCPSLTSRDILLIEGDSRVSAAIRYLTQSTWSHAALYVGPIIDRHEPDGEPHVLVEAELDEGVISSPLSKYKQAHSRICRPVGLASEDIDAVVSFAVERIGFTYDLKNIVDLVRYLLPTPPVPVRFRRRMIALGAGSPTRAICSTLIAQTFHSIRYPILPGIEIAEDSLAKLQSEYARAEILHIRSHTLFTPHDFDISPYFSVIKPMIEAGFDHRTLTWAEESMLDRIGCGSSSKNAGPEPIA